MASRKVLVVGSTGKQGGAVVDALLALPPASPPIHILGLTRNPDSPKAASLAAAHPGALTFVKGDTKDPGAVFAAHKDVASLFLMTVPPGEEAVGKAWVDAAVDAGVQQVVLSTLDRGGDDKSWTNPTDVKHFYEKHAYEVHLRDRAAALARDGRALRWTVLRPTAFLDNMNPGTFGKVFAAMWATMPAGMKLQFVSTRDIGLFAARAVADPAGWDRKALALAGDDLTYAEAREVFKEVVGEEMPQTWAILGRGMLWAIADVGKMFGFFEREGYGADIPALKKMEPRLQDFRTWLKESSGWKK